MRTDCFNGIDSFPQDLKSIKILKIESRTHADIPRIVGVVCSILQAGKKVPSLARQVALKSPKNSLLGAALPGDLMSGEFGDWEIRLVATPQAILEGSKLIDGPLSEISSQACPRKCTASCAEMVLGASAMQVLVERGWRDFCLEKCKNSN